ncbi:MAG: SDR family NAD(P)-dependent oxidoreductase [Deltaproteobacteria bacterium]
MRLIDRVAVVTGAGSGIGRAVACALAAEGADVVLAGRREAPLVELAEEIRLGGPRAIVVPTDVSIEAEVKTLFAQAVEECGRIDVLVNAAAGPGDEVNVANMEMATWQAMLDTALTGTMLCVRECLTRSMLSRRAGAIVNISSGAGLHGLAGKSHLSAAKAGLLQFSAAVAREVGPQGVRVNCIVPGAVSTERVEEYYHRLAAARGLDYERIVEEVSRGTAQSRHVSVAEVAQAVVFLATDQSSGITAQTLEVGGV